MSKLKSKREYLNLTQEELATKSGLLIRTIQRIELGVEPKGHTLKAVAKALESEVNELLSTRELPDTTNYTWIKTFNLSSIYLQ
ncbi:helix-turn-helix domain-containing protein [Aquimarina intermedia]|uniref:Helix-turn-helix protein n=1 Tax=Aquimarina intermedia TaxID=350814 RepID=A0A5S5C968_9FLAO|nr:helix-turn-helix transcriptional regulator [Aquimarina intermedia]TYP75847.1 helix-turn-helix protein [Aquimarina intermedia]